MIILTEYYWSGNLDRQEEINKSIKRNCELPQVECVVVFIEKSFPIPRLCHSKIKFNITKQRSVFADFFIYCNKNFEGKTCIICNNDISYNSTIVTLEGKDLGQRFLCLTRWDVGNKELSKHPKPELSQDSWVFKSPVADSLINLSNFQLGIPGCDNILAYVACVSGLNVVNPSLLIQTEHRHVSQYRLYDKNKKLGWGKRGSIYLNILPADDLEFNVENLIYRRFYSFKMVKGLLKHAGKVKVLTGQNALDVLMIEKERNIETWKDQLQ